MANKIVRSITPLQAGPWPCFDPFLFCSYHLDDYPKGNGQMGPAPDLRGRTIGQDFAGLDGWNMYHGDQIPGFPQHPHRGFETVTIARQGLVDHADSLGAAARFGEGDTQWITAGRGLSHSEMFPLVKDDAQNPLDLFQIWLNLPKKNKLVDPYFSIFWSEQTPRVNLKDLSGKTTEVMIIAGELSGVRPPEPPPNSWAADPKSDVAIWILKLEAGAEVTLPAAQTTSSRTLYFFKGSTIKVVDAEARVKTMIQVEAGATLTLTNGESESGLLLLQGQPLGEPVARYGPFVMNSEQEIRDAFAEYQRTRFGGWPWSDDAPVHKKDEPRFARYPDGRTEKKNSR